MFAGFAAAWAGLLAFDIIIFAMTVAKAIKVGRLGSRPLIDVVLRDGKSCFVTSKASVNIVCSTFRFYILFVSRISKTMRRDLIRRRSEQ
jgi:hypothetical protein